jgi:hypothetical protein
MLASVYSVCVVLFVFNGLALGLTEYTQDYETEKVTSVYEGLIGIVK